MEIQHTHQDPSGPSIVFRVKESIFSISGQDIHSILQFPEKLLAAPHAPAYVRGSFQVLDDIVTVVDMRSLFGWPTIKQEYRSFSEMIEERKRDHLHWVEVLRSCCHEGKPFPLTKDPHQCKLGAWRDQYQTESSVIAHQMSLLDGPHQTLHELAHTVLEHQAAGSSGKANEILAQMDSHLVPKILGLLDNMKTSFRETEYREIVLTLHGEKTVGLVADEVLGVEPLMTQQMGGIPIAQREHAFIRSIQKWSKGEELIMELDIPALLSSIRLNDWSENRTPALAVQMT